MGKALLNMPSMLQQRIIGTTINYILLEEMKESGFISQNIIDDLFKEYTGVDLNYACQTINTTFNDFIDTHFSTLFKNCYPHGLARLAIVDQKPGNTSFDSVGVVQQGAAAVTYRPIEAAKE